MKIPNTWAEMEFNEVFIRLRLKSYQLPTSKYLSEGRHPIIDQGKSRIAGYTNNDAPYSCIPFIIFGDHTKEIKYVSQPCYLGADGTQPLGVADCVHTRFGFYLLKNLELPDLGYSRYYRELQEQSFLVPPLPEQQKIADILGTWDEALEKLDALIAAKTRRKQALMQQLLTGHRRLPGFSKPWKQTRFGDLMKSEDRYADFNDDHLYHLVSARRRAEGVFFREALHGRDIKTKVMKQVRAGDFVISRMQVVHGGLGVVPPACDGYYASDSYEVLVPRDAAKLSPRFIGHLCRTRRFWHHALVCSHGVHIEKMTFVMADFEHEKFMIPELTEQTAIADILDTADAELRLLRQQRTALDHQKRGLMQQLLTGRIRVAAP